MGFVYLYRIYKVYVPCLIDGSYKVVYLLFLDSTLTLIETY